jgi:hypothetical protein
MTASLYFVALHGNTLAYVTVKQNYHLTLCALIPFGGPAENLLRGPERRQF